MAKRNKQRLKSPCGCGFTLPRIIVEGEPPAPHHIWGIHGTPADMDTPAYDPTLKQWFLSDLTVLPDPDRDALICLECNEPTDGIIGFGDGADEVSGERELAGLNPAWHFEWIQ
jgi:hypothetical protein